MFSDTFTAGVVPGGLTDHKEIKILICVVLNSIAEPVSNSNLLEAFTEEGYANYFECADAISDLIAAGQLIQNEANEYSLSDSGRTIAAELYSDLPATVRERVTDKAFALHNHSKKEKHHRVDIIKRDDAYFAVCKLCESNGTEVFSVSITVPTKAVAQTVRERFVDNAEEIVRLNMRLLTGESL
ncbi:MAG: DUF4364 family protein [Ruminococcaceae bacterium]|nr:DUF4364 family protein [Oscillospiraceae bacterium]